MEKISFPLPAESTLFNFEKVSKRAHFDIASVNSAIWITLDGGIMRQVHLSAGGVAPIPLYLSDTSHYSTGRKPDIDTVREAASIAQSEISPIGDVRGSAVYKRLLPRQLIHAHFITLFPEKIPLEGLLDSSANTSSGNLQRNGKKYDSFLKSHFSPSLVLDSASPWRDDGQYPGW